MIRKYANRYEKVPEAWWVMKDEMIKDKTIKSAEPLIKEFAWFETMLLILMLPKPQRLPEVLADERNTQIHQIATTLSKLKQRKMIKISNYRCFRVIEPTRKGTETTIFILNRFCDILNRNFDWRKYNKG